jgi:hypothetical protein
MMSGRMVKRICIVSAMDFAYRVFLRGSVRRWAGIETRTTYL